MGQVMNFLGAIGWHENLGSGNDTYWTTNTGYNFNMVEGGSGHDDIFGYDGSDWFYGGSGDDRLVGNNGTDVLYGGTGRDDFTGGRGNDLMDAGKDNDVDHFFYNSNGRYENFGTDTIKNFNWGDDKLLVTDMALKGYENVDGDLHLEFGKYGNIILEDLGILADNPSAIDYIIIA
ncbi:MAG: calcium-binding protein [Methyloligellaceae bacterium]